MKKGLTVVTPTELKKMWKLGAKNGRPWMGRFLENGSYQVRDLDASV